MGIRDIANAALDAEKAHDEAEKKRLWRENAKAGERIVGSILGVSGTARLAKNVDAGEFRFIGDDTVVQIDSDVYVVVRNHTCHTGKADMWGNRPKEQVTYLSLCDHRGSTMFRTEDGIYYSVPERHKEIKSLPDLARALDALDKDREDRIKARAVYEQRFAEAKAKKATKV